MQSSSCSKLAVKSAFYGVSLILAIFVPNVIAIVIGMNKVTSFCDENQNLCDLFKSPDDSNPLVREERMRAYLWGGFTSFGGMVAGIVFLLLANCLYSKCFKERFKAKPDDQVQLIINAGDDESEDSCRFFKTCKENLLPTKKKEIYQVVATSVSFFGGTIFTAFCMAYLFSPCINDGMALACADVFPHAGVFQLQKITDFSNSLYKTMVVSETVIGVIVGLIMSVGMVALAACVKNRLYAASEEKKIKLYNDTTYGSGGKFEL